MDTIAIEANWGAILRNSAPDRHPAAWAGGMWFPTTLGPDIHIRVGWDGLINRAYNNGDEEPSGHWVAE